MNVQISTLLYQAEDQFAPSLQIVAVTDNFLDTLIYICYFSKKKNITHFADNYFVNM